MKHTFGLIAALALVAVGTGTAAIYGGFYDVGADAPHWPLTYRLLDTARIRSIEAHASGLTVPTDLENHARLVEGASHFSTHCAVCHSGPGVEAEDMAEGMYPRPPVLTDVSKRYSPAELFWILKHGIKMSGMPAWADHGDEALWNIVGLLEKLPSLSPQDYAALVVAANKAGGHHMHGGAMNMGSMGGMAMPSDAAMTPATSAPTPRH